MIGLAKALFSTAVAIACLTSNVSGEQEMFNVALSEKNGFVAEAPVPDSDHRDRRGRRDRTRDVELKVNHGWHKFNFGNSGTNVSTTFRFNNTFGDFTSIFITDLYYPGDSFAVYVDDSYLGSSCLKRSTECTSTECPNVAFNSSVWSSHCFTVAGGAHEMVIGVNQSPFTGGRAAVKVVDGARCSVFDAC